MKKFIMILLLTGCISTPSLPKAEPLVNLIEPEMEQIEAKGGPEVTPHVKAVRKLYPQIKRVEHKAEEQSTLEKYLPWVICLISIGFFIWGASTKDLSDTIGGAVGLFVGIAVSYFWSTLAWFGLGVLIVFGVVWSVISYEWKKSNRKDPTDGSSNW
jgi:hypothetical protein